MAVRVKLSDVARRARVSAMSVSNYMNGRHGTMTEETRDRIAEAVTVLNYRPDMAARSVRTSKIQSVGLIVVDESPTYLSDGYTTQLVSGLGDALNAKGYTLQLEGLTASRLSASTLIRQRQTDGLCVLPTGSLATRKEIIRTVAGTGQPFVLLLESLPRAWPDACCVLQTDRQGARELARHVLERGARDLVVLKQSHNHWQAVAERQVGIEEAVAQFGEAASLKVTQCGSGDVAATAAALDAYLANARLPDAFMATNDQIGIAVLKYLKARGIAVPGDVLVTGFNAFDFWQFSDPVLTTVRSPGFELGHRAGEAMIERMEKGVFAERRITLETTFQPSETT